MLLILTPLLLFVIVCLKTKTKLELIGPLVNDELGYWRELYSFSKCGFNFGKNGFLGYELAQVGSFGCHGVSPLVAWWWYALLFPWENNSIVIANIILLTFSLIVFVVLVRPKKIYCFLFILLLMSSRHLNIYYLSSLMELPCYSAIIMNIAAIIYYQKHQDSKIGFALCVFFSIYAAFLRICYIALLFPAIVINNNYKINYKLIIKIILMFVLFVAIYEISTKTTAKYINNWFLSDLSNNNSFNEIIIKIYEQINVSAKRYFVQIYDRINWFLSKYFSISGIKTLIFEEFPQLFFTQRIFSIAIIVFLAFFSFKYDEKSHRVLFFNMEYLSFFILLLVLQMSIFIFYSVEGFVDIRTIMPIVFGISIWLVYMRMDTLLSNNLIIPVFVFLFLTSIFVITISFGTHNVNINNKKEYDELFSVLDEPKQSLEVSMDLDMIDSIDGYSIVSSINPKYGILLYMDENMIKKSKPEIVYSKETIKNDDYYLFNYNDKYGFIYLLK